MYVPFVGQAALLRALRWGRLQVVFKDYPRIIESIQVPTLILQGRHAPYIPLAHALRLRQDIRASNLVIIEDGAHFLPIDTPQRVAQGINGFIYSF